jgi:3-methylfumaryl-CoA hydratase
MTDTLDHLRDWIGIIETMTDVATAWPVSALSATLDRRDPDPAPGDPVPPGWHWLYFLETKPGAELGPDGHPRRGGFLPPVPLPRRMWAGGRIEFRRVLRVGESLKRESEIISIQPKRGKSGNLLFVTVRHSVFASSEIAVIEEHDIVYREAAGPNDPKPSPLAAPRQATWRREMTPDAVLLFRFSALIFNAHRIHFDRDYCHEEGYPGLVVHGPLQTILLLDLCRRQDARTVSKLDYRALHPAFHDERLAIGGEPSGDGSSAQLWTGNAAGNMAMSGTAYF